MEKKKQQAISFSSSSPMNKLDHLFGPKDSSSSVFGSIFPPPSALVGGRDPRLQDVGCKNKETQGNQRKEGESSGGSMRNNENEAVEASYYSSSIYYGGQENYSQRGHPLFKKDRNDGEDPNGNSSNSASRGNWWQGSLYY